MQLHAQIQATWQPGRAREYVWISLRRIGLTRAGAQFVFIVHDRAKEASVPDQGSSGAMADGHDTSYASHAREFTQRLDQPGFDAVDIERAIPRSLLRTIGARALREQRSMGAPQADFGVGFANVDDDRAILHHARLEARK
jgi:hypothetical protein